MIDIQKIKQVFKEYVKNHDPENPKIILKIAHIERVAGVAKEIAESLNLLEEDVKLAETIGVLHDIGRFEQVRLYNSFVDYKTVDHAEKGCEVLFKDNKIRDFIETNKYDDIIQKAIKNHNKFEIEKGLSERELLHAKLIRDADKLDIFCVNIIEKDEVKAMDFSEREGISEKVLKDFFEKKLIYGPDRKTFLDYQIGIIAFIFDLNFIPSLKMVKEKQYIDEILKHTKIYREEDKEQMENVRKFAKQYIEEKLKE